MDKTGKNNKHTCTKFPEKAQSFSYPLLAYNSIESMSMRVSEICHTIETFHEFFIFFCYTPLEYYIILCYSIISMVVSIRSSFPPLLAKIIALYVPAGGSSFDVSSRLIKPFGAGFPQSINPAKARLSE